MDFLISKKELSFGVELCKRFLDKSLTGATEMVRLEAKENFVVLTAISFTKGCKVKLEAVVKKQGTCIINGEKLMGVSGFLSGEEANVQATQSAVVIKNKGFEFSLRKGDPELFLGWPTVPTKFLTVDSKRLNTVIDTLRFATVPSGDFSNVVKSPLYGIIFFKGGTAFATDTAKMAVLYTEDIGEFSVDLSMTPVFKSLKDGDIGISKHGGKVFLRTDKNLFFFNSIGTERPNVEKVLSTFDFSKATHYQVKEVNSFAEALKKLSVFDDEVVLWCKNDHILMGSCSEHGDATTVFHVIGVGEEREPFVIKSKSLVSSLNVCESADLYVFEKGLALKDGNYLALIMPKIAQAKVEWLKKKGGVTV